MGLQKFYRWPALSPNAEGIKRQAIQSLIPAGTKVIELKTEYCFYLSLMSDVSTASLEKLKWILSRTFQESNLSTTSSLAMSTNEMELLIEIGPRLNFSTPFSSNAIANFLSVGINEVNRIERSIRYYMKFDKIIPTNIKESIIADLHDCMTQCHYIKPLEDFHVNISKEHWYEVNVLREGKNALQKINCHLGLALDEWDLAYYESLFKDKLCRNPTSVECFDLAQSNSEHSRHWFFKGKLIIDGITQNESLFDKVISTQNFSNRNNVIKFSDNSSGIEGYKVTCFIPEKSWAASPFCLFPSVHHIILTAETHNFPTGVEPFSGATTGTGGRIRDIQAAGRGAHVIAGTAGYCFGNLLLPDYELPWEDQTFLYPENFALPRHIAVEASNGASDYGNKFGEPVIAGFARSFGMLLPNGERKEWIKPIMFSGGLGSIDDEFIKKMKVEPEMEVIKLGGPAYCIGVGGGSASSVEVQGDNKSELDFKAVQRGDPEMEQKLNRVIRACIENRESNPICSIHDQGAGGNGNVLKELVEPVGAAIYTKEFLLGDSTMNTLELWGAEYQENNAILIKSKDTTILKNISNREKCPISFVGKTTGDKKIKLIESRASDIEKKDTLHPVDLELDFVLGKMPQKTFHLKTIPTSLVPLHIPSSSNPITLLQRVIQLPSVGSKRFLTTKVDRCVTGLIALQQCIGPLHIPLADAAVVALSYFETVGAATSIGEQPIKGLINPAVGARMSVAEAITNLTFTQITTLRDVKCSANWMWAAKLPGEGAALNQACAAMTEVMKTLGIAVDGGKDSLSMAARVGNETVKSPGTVVISTYAPCPDIRNFVTPDLKCPIGKGCLLYIDLSCSKCRLGGSALSQILSQIGDEAPDLDQPELLLHGFNIMQDLLKDRTLLSGHDISDGGVITCLLEMAFAGNCGVNVDFKKNSESEISVLFTEEVGWIIEVNEIDVVRVIDSFQNKGIACSFIGHSVGKDFNAEILVHVNGKLVIEEKMAVLRDCWEATSFHLEKRQCNVECVTEEEVGLKYRTSPKYKTVFEIPLNDVSIPLAVSNRSPCVAVVREEGTNGDREMAAAFSMAGFDVWDVMMTDLMTDDLSLDRFQGLIFPGGFSFGDVLGSAKGWSACMKFNENINKKLKAFYSRQNTFSLGVCNGCQLMAQMNWIIPATSNGDDNSGQGIALEKNLSERFECRFSTVEICDSPSIMFDGMNGSVLGVWVAHAEGRFVFRNEAIQSEIETKRLVPLRYVDDNNCPTITYPFNPNGSIGGIAGICSEDGRHLALMPHPERCFLFWQWPWVPSTWDKHIKFSPWFKMFTNAYRWCINNP